MATPGLHLQVIIFFLKKINSRHLTLIFLFLTVESEAQTIRWSELKPGSYEVGFKTQWQTGADGKLLLFSIWYPAKADDHKMRIKDYIISGSLDRNVIDTSISKFKRVLALPFVYNLKNIPDDIFNNAIDAETNAWRDAKIIGGKYPLIIASSDPVSFFVTFEYLASHGFVVAAFTTKWEDVNVDSLLYKQQTEGAQQLLNYMMQQTYVAKENISTFGFGGGIQSAVYITMRTSRIKRIINMDGGFFGLRSKSTASVDYKPERLVVPMLHLISAQTLKADDAQQFKELKNPIIRASLKSDRVFHQDFNTFGRMVAAGLNMRGLDSKEVNNTFKIANELLLQFLQEKPLTADKDDLFWLERFNQ